MLTQRQLPLQLPLHLKVSRLKEDKNRGGNITRTADLTWPKGHLLLKCLSSWATKTHIELSKLWLNTACLWEVENNCFPTLLLCVVLFFLPLSFRWTAPNLNSGDFLFSLYFLPLSFWGDEGWRNSVAELSRAAVVETPPLIQSPTQKHFLMFRQNLLCIFYAHCQLSIVLAAGNTGKSLALSSLHPPFIDIDKITPEHLLQAEYFQLSQPFLIGEIHQTVHHFHGPLRLSSVVPYPSYTWSPALDTELQMWPHQCWGERKDHLPCISPCWTEKQTKLAIY